MLDDNDNDDDSDDDSNDGSDNDNDGDNDDNNDCKYMKIIYVHCGWINGYRIDPCSYEYYWTSGENKAWKMFRSARALNPWPLRYRYK